MMTYFYGWSLNSEASLYEKLREDLKTAMKKKEDGVRDTIRMVMSEFPKLTVPITLDSGKKSVRCKKEDEITNEDIMSIILSLIKSEKILLEAKKETSSLFLEVLQEYIPKPANEEEIRKWIRENMDLSAIKNPMNAMGPVMKHFGQRADGALVKKVLQETLSP